MKLKKKIATIALVILVTATVFWVFRSEKGFPNCYSTVKAATPSLAVYSDSEAQSPLTTVNWGTVTLGVASTATFYLENTGSSSFLLESPTASDFVYEDASDNAVSGDYSQDFTLTLNCTGVQLNPGNIIPAQLSLVIGSGIDSEHCLLQFQHWTWNLRHTIKCWLEPSVVFSGSCKPELKQCSQRHLRG